MQTYFLSGGNGNVVEHKNYTFGDIWRVSPTAGGIKGELERLLA